MFRRKVRTVLIASPRRMLIALPLLLPAPHAAAQQDPGVQSALADLAQTYSSTTICERVGVQVRQHTLRNQTRISQAGYAFRFSTGSSSARSALSLELHSLQLDASAGQLTLAHQRDPSTYFRAPIAQELTSRALWKVLPPVPLPQLDIAAAARQGAPWTEVPPYATGIRWETLTTDPRSTSARTISGSCKEGRVSAVLRGSRLHALTIERNEPRTTIRLTFAAMSACDSPSDRPIIDVDRRTRVESIGDLRPKASALAIDQALPEVKVSTADGAPWSLADLLEAPPDAVIAGIPPAEHAVLILTRVQPPGVLPSLTRINFDRLGQSLRELRAAAFEPTPAAAPPADAPEPPPRFGFARVLAFDNPPPEQVLDAIQTTARSWGMRQTLWAASYADSIDLLAPGAEAIVLVIDSKQIIRAVISLSAESSTDALEGQILSALFEVFAPRGRALFDPASTPTLSEPKSR